MVDQILDIAVYLDGLPFTGDSLERQSLGGEQTAFIYTARELARLGHKVTAYCPCPQEGVFDGVTYKDVSKLDELTKRNGTSLSATASLWCLANPFAPGSGFSACMSF